MTMTMTMTLSLMAYQKALQIKKEVIDAGKRGLPFPQQHQRYRDLMDEDYREALERFERMRDRMRL